MKKRTNATNTWRFSEKPSLQAKHTSISDADVLLSESVLDLKQFKKTKEFNLPYINNVRDHNTTVRRLTGLMLVETKAFCTEDLLKAQETVDDKGND